MSYNVEGKAEDCTADNHMTAKWLHSWASEVHGPVTSCSSEDTVTYQEVKEQFNA